MQLSAILILGVCLQAAATGHSQSITFSGNNVPLEQVVKVIKQQTGFETVYDQSIAHQQIKSVNAYQLSLDEFLAIALKSLQLDFIIESKTVFLREKKPAADLSPRLILTPPPITIRGRVVNEKGEPVIASIIIKGTKRGTTTGIDGNFTLSDVNENVTLIISGVSIETQELKVNGRASIIIKSITKINAEEEVIIRTDYFGTTKRKSTMNISKVDGKEIQNQPVTSIINAVIGRVPGIDITPTNNTPGRAPTIQIRGNNSLSFLGSLPLYVIDGIQIESRPLNDPYGPGGGYDPVAGISPANIESIEVLKDAAATAIYGSRGANGVIRITTKRAKLGKGGTNVDLNVYTGVGRIANKVDLLNKEQYLAMRHEAFKNAGTTSGTFDYDLNGMWDTTRVTDWQDVLLGGTANITDLQGSFSGGNELTSFRLAGGYHKETTVFPGSDDFSYQRATGDFSFRHLSLNKKFEVTAGVNFGFTDHHTYNYSQFATIALTLPPIAPKLYNNDGTLNWQDVETPFKMSTWSNPLAELLNPNDIRTTTILSSASLAYELMPGLKLKLVSSLSNINSDETRENPVSAMLPAIRPYVFASMNFVDNRRTSFMVEPQLAYALKIKKHNFNTIGGLTYQQSRTIYKSVQGEGYPTDALLGSIRGATTVTNLADVNSQYKYISAYVHFGYDFKDRYLIDLTGRRDGSSKFGPNNRFGNFWAIGAGWIFSEEALLKENVSFLSFGKIRGSYGVTGNDQIGDYGYLDTYTILNPGYQTGVSLIPSALYNPDYKWEETRKSELGIELGLFKNRVTIETSWYRNVSSNQLVNYQLSDVTGFESVLSNFNATIQNTGWELAVTTRNIVRENFQWTTSFNLSVPRNKLVKFDGLETSPYAFQYQIGQPLTIQRRYTYVGIDPATGLYILDDVNKDGVYNNDDMKFSKVMGRRSYYGMNNTFAYKNLELSFLLQFSNNPIIDNGFTSQPGALSNQPIEVLNRWQKSGDETEYQKFLPGFDFGYNYFQNSDYGVRDASFVRLKTLSLSYQLKAAFLERIHMQDARLYLQGQNLFTISKLNSYDPETGSAMPPLRMLSIGLQLKL